MNDQQHTEKRTAVTVNVRMLTVTALMSAISIMLMLLRMPLPIFPSFLKMDLSDLPALIVTFIFGPLSGIMVELIKNLANVLFSGTTSGFIGEFSNFLIGVALVLPSGFVYRLQKNKTRKALAFSLLCGVLSMALCGGLSNYFIMIPFYTSFMPMEAIIGMCQAIIPAVNSLETVILLSIIPFNLCKGALVSLITYLIYDRVRAKAL